MSLSLEIGPLKELLRLNDVISLVPNTTGNCLYKEKKTQISPQSHKEKVISIHSKQKVICKARSESPEETKLAAPLRFLVPVTEEYMSPV